MIKAIVFDCFGVLVGGGFWSLYRSLGGDPDKHAAYIDEVLNQADSGQISQDKLVEIMSEHLGVTAEDYKNAYKKDYVINKPVFDFIRGELKPHYKLGIISNIGPGLIEGLIPPELLALFDSVVASGEVGLLKPDPAIFRLAAERLQVPPEQIVFTDDHASYLPGAQSIGMQTILYTDLDDFKLRLNELLGDETGLVT